MDWSDSEELRTIFRDEVGGHSGRLIEGAEAMLAGPLGDSRLEQLVRASHTVKGDARVMGYPRIGDAAAVLEALFRDLRVGHRPQTPGLARSIAALCRTLVPTVESEPTGDTAALDEALERLRGHGENPGTARAGVSNGPGTPPVAFATPVRPRHDIRVVEAPKSERGAVSGEPGSPDLGGLLATLEGRIVGSTTAVDTAKLYRLINQSVEARLDADALTRSVRSFGGLEVEHIESALGGWEEAVSRLEQSVQDMQRRAVELAAVPVHDVTDAFPQLVRYLGRRTGKDVRFEIFGDDVQVDRQILDTLREPLRHLLVNAIDHGVEAPAERLASGKPVTGTVAIRWRATSDRLRITVEDDGSGIDWPAVESAARRRGLTAADTPVSEAQLARLLFTPGFSTVEPHELSGDGSGLAAVAEIAEAMNGGLSIETEPNVGTSVVLTLPSSMSVQNVLLVRSGGHSWGIPEAAVLATFPITAAQPAVDEDRFDLWFQGETLLVSSFSTTVGLPDDGPVSEVVVLTTRVGPVALTVPEILGRRHVAVKALGPMLAGTPHLTGAALLGGGDVVVVVEPNRLGERAGREPAQESHRPRILIVDDSHGVRQLVSAALASHGFETLVAEDAEAGLRTLEVEDFDALVVDFQMPGSNGVEFVRRVRTTSPALAVVMMSAVAGVSDQADAWEAGVDAFFDKSDIRKGVLASTIRSLLESRGLVGRTAERSP